MFDTRIHDLMRLLVDYSIEVKPGQLVLIQGSIGATDYFHPAYAAILARGGHPFTRITMDDLTVELIRNGSDEQLDWMNPITTETFKRIDGLISFAGNKNARYLANLPAEKVKQHVHAQREWRRYYLDRTGSGELRWVGWMPPIEGMAQEAGMSAQEFADFVYAACKVGIGTDPIAAWKKVKVEQDKIIAWLDKRSVFHFQGEGTDVKFNAKGRTWVNCCGTRNMPDGEIFTSPVDDSAEGVMTFRYPALFNGQEVEGIRLVFRAGEVAEATAEKGEDLLHSLISIDEGARRCGEISIGTNYDIQRFSKVILFDEKIGGTIHMALGNAMPYAGGVNKSAIHWDMIADMTTGEISADGEVFYRNGKLLI